MSYSSIARERAQALGASGQARVLAIETSCDETGVAVVENGRRIIGQALSTQMQTHAQYGGVVPEIASRMHTQWICDVTREAMDQAGMELEAVDAIAVTYGPGLVGALLVGVAYAKALAFALEKPLVAVHHIQGHIAANYLAYPELEPPFLCLIASGGHTQIAVVEEYGRARTLARTRDDAAGEAFDKVARVLSLGYPGGPRIDAAAASGNAEAFAFPRAKLEGLDFSFSGLKTAVINMAHGFDQRGEKLPAADFAASFRRAVVDVLVSRMELAARETGHRKWVLAGGVAANALLREEFRAAAARAGAQAYLPPLELCTDNAAMIASAGFYRLMKGEIADLTLNAVPTMALA